MCLICSCLFSVSSLFFFNDTATTEIYTLSLHDALPIYRPAVGVDAAAGPRDRVAAVGTGAGRAEGAGLLDGAHGGADPQRHAARADADRAARLRPGGDRGSRSLGNQRAIGIAGRRVQPGHFAGASTT